MITLLLTAAMIVIINPPEGELCEQTGLRVVLASGQAIGITRASYSPDGQAIEITPTRGIFCDGFEGFFRDGFERGILIKHFEEPQS